MDLIHAQNLECWRGEKCVVQNLSFALRTGEIQLVLGANGAGKTSLLRAIAGLLPFEGQLTLPSSVGPLLYLGTAYPRHSQLPVKEILRFYYGMIPKLLRKNSVAAALAYVGLTSYEHEPVITLSEGQKKRLSLACLYLQRARIWLLDEPTNTLDAPGMLMLKTLLNEHLATGGSAMIATHDPSFWPEYKCQELLLTPSSSALASPLPINPSRINEG